jgi:hypothetical protein
VHVGAVHCFSLHSSFFWWPCLVFLEELTHLLLWHAWKNFSKKSCSLLAKGQMYSPCWTCGTFSQGMWTLSRVWVKLSHLDVGLWLLALHTPHLFCHVLSTSSQIISFFLLFHLILFLFEWARVSFYWFWPKSLGNIHPKEWIGHVLSSLSVSQLLIAIKIFEIISLWRENLHFSSQFWRLQAMIGWPCCFGWGSTTGLESVMEPNCSPHHQKQKRGWRSY